MTSSASVIASWVSRTGQGEGTPTSIRFSTLLDQHCDTVSQVEIDFLFEEDIPVKLVRSVDRAIKILILVAQADEPIGLSEISRITQIDKATALRLLSTLEASKLVQRDPSTRRYGPGHNIWRLASYWRNDLRTASRPHLEALRRATEETVSLVCPRGLERVVIDALAARTSFAWSQSWALPCPSMSVLRAR